MIAENYKDRRIANTETVKPVAEDLPDGPRAVLEYWMSLQIDGAGPHFSKFRLDELPLRIIPASILCDVVDGGKDLRYRFFGSDRVRSHGEDYTNSYVSKMAPQDLSRKVMAEIGTVMKGKKPVVVNTVAIIDGEECDYSMLRLPLFDDVGEIIRVFSMPFNSTGPELPERQWGNWFGRHSKVRAI